MKLCVTVCVLIAIVMLPLIGSTDTSAPKPDFAPMTYFVGLWNCKISKNPDSALVGTKYSFAGWTDKDGYWEILEVRDGHIHITRDAQKQLWTFIYLGNGGDYSVMTTPGWTGNTLTLREVLTYGKAPQGEARFTKLGDSKFQGDYSARTSSGIQSYQTLCTRV